MKKTKFPLVILFVLFCYASQAKDPVIISTFQKSEILIDGDITDWSEMAIYDDQSSIVMNLSNDNDFIYVKFRIANYGSISRIFKGGFSVWFNEEGKKKRKVGFRFPISDEIAHLFVEQERIAQGVSRDQAEVLFRNLMSDLNIRFANDISNAEIVDDENGTAELYSLKTNKVGLSARLNFIDFDLMIYEAKLPLDLFFSDKEKFLGSKKNCFVLGYEIGQYTDEKMKKEADKQRASQGLQNVGRNYRYNSRYTSMLDRYGDFPSIIKWYKKVYLSKE